MSHTHRSVLESIDGTGKSTAALYAAQRLSEAYPGQRISVVDSEGVYAYRGGELDKHALAWLERLEPHQAQAKALATAKLGGFTLARRAAEMWATHYADLVVGVRDPFRIEPATYSLIFGPTALKQLSPQARLRMVSLTTAAPHPEVIVHLQPQGGVNTARPVAGNRGRLDSHETPEKLQRIAAELPRVLAAYSELYGSPVVEVEALTPSSGDSVAAQLEPLIDRPLQVAFSLADLALKRGA